MAKHKGAPRRYWCAEYFDADGALKKDPNNPMQMMAIPSSGCGITTLLRDGEVIPICPVHGTALMKPRFKRCEDRWTEARDRSQLEINGTFYWSDVAVRKAKCRLCHGDIVKGERRIAMDGKPQFGGMNGARTTLHGGVITRTRAYVHASCFIDMVFGGKAGEGCPGCSAKILHDEFMQVRGLLEKEYGDG